LFFYYVKPEGPKLLTNAIIKLIQDSQKRQVLSAKAMQRSTFFTQEKMLAETRKIYEQILKD
jgi:glycosyltransferase involved in cell wall biosynthesis